MLLEASVRILVLDRADKRATCPRESTTGSCHSVRKDDQKAEEVELITFLISCAWGYIKDLIITETIFTRLSHILIVLGLYNSNSLVITQPDALI